MSENDFVDNGFDQLCAGIDEQVRPDVEREYAERLAVAGFWQRRALRREMEAEIKHRVAEEIEIRHISPDALY